MYDNDQVTINWLVRFRWIAIFFQVFAYFFGVKLGYIENSSIIYYASIVLTMSLINISFIWNRFSFYKNVFFHVAIDLISFALLIYFSGRMHNPFWPLIYLHAGLGAILIRPSAAIYFFLLLCGAMTFIQYFSQAYHFAILYTMLPQWIILLSVWFLTREVGKLLMKQSLEISNFQKREMNFQKIKSIGSISAGILHELGTPLNTVRLKLDKIYDENNDDLIVMNKALIQCEDTINKVNTIQGESSQSLQLNDIGEFVDEYFSNYKEDFFFNNKGTTSYLCTFSKINLGIVFDVIINNAIEAKATPVLINLVKTSRGVKLTFKDTGSGFDQFILDNFGSPYITTKGRGHGLGLFTSLMNIEAMGGEMSISNTDEGSLITIELV